MFTITSTISCTNHVDSTMSSSPLTFCLTPTLRRLRAPQHPLISAPTPSGPPRHPRHPLRRCSSRRATTCARIPSHPVLHEHTTHVPSSLPIDNSRPVPVTLKCEHLGGRKRRISGSILIPTSPIRIWTVLTSYAQIDRYMPNIIESRLQRRGNDIYLDQVGIISRKLSLRSRMLLRVREDAASRTVVFTRVEGRDFLHFEASYAITDARQGSCLSYQMVAVPFPLFPMSMVERKIAKEVPKMLASVREEAILGRCVPIHDNNTSTTNA